MNKRVLFTSESVTEGHPDKMCDRISDSILDEIIANDPQARVACETVASTGMVAVMGEITTNAIIDIPSVVRNTISEIGYESKFGFDDKMCSVMTLINKQSEDIALGVDRSREYKNKKGSCTGSHRCDEDGSVYDVIGAGDQGMMFGYACNDTEDYMPMPIYYAHKICEQLSRQRKSKELDYLGPDGKSMVTVEYEGQMPVRIDTVVVSSQHIAEVEQSKIYADIIEKVILPVLPEELVDEKIKLFINPTGRFIKGGPCADTGLTGRKIIVDTYGGMGRHGGGAFSGKDPTKVDRTGAYAARYVAKNIVAAGLADRCEVQIAYVIGVANPVSVNVNTFGTGKVDDTRIISIISELFDLRPAVLIDVFDLRRPIYKQLAAYGHFGRSGLNLPWEKLDRVGEIRKLAKL